MLQHIIHVPCPCLLMLVGGGWRGKPTSFYQSIYLGHVDYSVVSILVHPRWLAYQIKTDWYVMVDSSSVGAQGLCLIFVGGSLASIWDWICWAMSLWAKASVRSGLLHYSKALGRDSRMTSHYYGQVSRSVLKDLTSIHLILLIFSLNLLDIL